MKRVQSEETWVLAGNAHDEGRHRHGWFIGHFLEEAPGDPRRTDHLEVHLRHHRAGDEKGGWTRARTATTLVLLIRGRFVVEFRGPDGRREVRRLAREGDYVLWGPGIPHTWRAEQETLVVTVRWPSSAGDAVPDP